MTNCPEGAFKGDLGKIPYKDKMIKIIGRQSDRYGAIKIMDELKDRILNDNFPLNCPVEKLSFKVDKY